MTSDSNTTSRPWFQGYPEPKSTVSGISRSKLLGWMKDGKQAGRDFVLVDLRWTDYRGGSIKGAINLPAGSLHPAIPSLYNLFSVAGVETIIWFCNTSRGRGTRAAAWMADYIQDRKDRHMESIILEEGIKGWATAGEEYVEYMTEYDASVWCIER